MKKYIKNLKLTLFSTFIVTTSISSFAQQTAGTSLTDAILVPTPTPVCNQMNDVMQTQTKFFKVMASSEALNISVTQNTVTPAEITKMTILDSNLNTVVPIMETTLKQADGSMNLTIDGLNTGQTCFIQLDRQATTTGDFNMCVKEEPNPTTDPAKNIVLVKPMFAQGYLVLDNQKFDVSRWDIRIVKKTFTADNSKSTRFKTTTTIVDKIALPAGINYYFVPYEYRGQSFSENYLVDIRGINANGETVVENQNVQLNDENGGLDIIQECGPCVSYLENCAKVCNETQVAYRIQQFTKFTSPTTSLSRYDVRDAFTNFDPLANTATPFYWFIEMDKFNAPGNQCVNIGQGCLIDNNIGNVIGPFNANAVTYHDPAGNVLSGLVVGIRKTRGKWGAKNYINTGNQFTNTDAFCSSQFTIQNAMSLVNANGNFFTPQGVKIDDLECIPLPSFIANGGSDGASSCYDLSPDPISDPGNGSTDGTIDFFDDIITQSLGCICESSNVPMSICDDTTNSGTNPTIAPSWQNVIERVIISDLNNPTKAPITVVTADLFKSNNGNGNGQGSGWFKGLSLILEPGLYSFGMAFNNGEYRRRILEVTTTVTSTSQLANLVDIVVFPNPIVGKKYSLKLTAQAKLHFNYEVRDFMGNLVYSKNINVNKGEDKTISITAPKLPSGRLFHRFIFDDGSVKAIQTLKN